MKKKILLLISHIEHTCVLNNFYAHAPFVKEINYIGSNFDEINIFAPLSKKEKLKQDSQLHANMINNFISVPKMGGSSIYDKVKIIIKFPLIFLKLTKTIFTLRNDDLTIHIRTPGNIGLISLFVMPFFPAIKKFTKYTGEWHETSKLPFTYKLQVSLLKNISIFNGLVLAYTNKEKVNIISSYAASLTNIEIQNARDIASTKIVRNNLSVIFVGRLTENKGVDLLLKAMKEFSKINKITWRLIICGTGDYEEKLKGLASSLNIQKNIQWKGWLDNSGLKKVYSKAHIICQPSIQQESWGKALQEGMAYGCIPLASNIGGPKSILSEQPFFLFKPGDYRMISKKINEIVNDEQKYFFYKNWTIDKLKINSLEDYNNHIKKELKKFYR